MPLYEYKCLTCSRHTEKRQKFSDPEITECPHCGGPIKRVLTAPAISFKGGGWYADGYGNPKPQKSDKESSEAKGGASAAPPATSPDSKDAPAKPAAPASKETSPAPSSTPASATPAPTPSPAKKE